MSRALRRIVGILDCFTPQRASLQLAEIAEMSGLDRATTLRFLGALERQRLVRRDPQSKRYALGSKLVQWGALALDGSSLRAIADPVMRRLNLETQETIALFVRDGASRVCIATYESPHPIRHVLPIGLTLRVTQAAGGLATLAALPAAEAQALIDADPLLSEDERRALVAELPRARARGYAFGVRMMTPNAWSLAAPIYDYTATAVATLVISGPDSRIDDEVAARHARLLLPAAAEVSQTLGAPAQLLCANEPAYAQ